MKERFGSLRRASGRMSNNYRYLHQTRAEIRSGQTGLFGGSRGGGTGLYREPKGSLPTMPRAGPAGSFSPCS